MFPNAKLAVLIVSFECTLSAGQFIAPPAAANPENEQARQLAMLAPLLDADAVKQSALADYKSGRFEIAAEKLKQIAYTSVSTASDHYWLAEAYFHLKQFDRAAEEFSKAAASMDEARIRDVETLIALNRREQAKVACMAYLSAANNSPYTHARLKCLQRVLSGPANPKPKRSGAVEK